MSILSGFKKQKRYIRDDQGDHQLISEWTATDTIELSNIDNNETTLAEATEWDDTYNNVNTQPETMSGMMTKLTSTYANTKYLKNKTDEINAAVEELQELINTALLEKVYPVGALYWSSDSTDPGTLFGFGQWERVKDKFIVAAGDTISAGSTGGAKDFTYTPSGTISDKSITLTTSNMPKHSHSLNSHTHSLNEHTHSLNEHTHTMAHTHSMKHTHSIPGLSFSGTTGEAGAHSHKYDYPTPVPTASGSGDPSETIMTGHYSSYNTTSNGSHSHSFSGTTSGGTSGASSAGSTGASSAENTGKAIGNTGKASGNTGKASGNTGEAGSGTAFTHNHTFTGTQKTINTMPPYKAYYCWERVE